MFYLNRMQMPLKCLTGDSLAKAFTDVFPVELSPRIPPMRDIQYCINFIPSASIPNRATYRTSPNEHEELQWQVQELLEKGVVHETMSSCAAPPLLVPIKDGSRWMCMDIKVVNKITIKYRFPSLGSITRLTSYTSLVCSR